ncbi:hypothetical protein JOQ06_004335, partial [Pogonophryne albipinna]
TGLITATKGRWRVGVQKGRDPRFTPLGLFETGSDKAYEPQLSHNNNNISSVVRGGLGAKMEAERRFYSKLTTSANSKSTGL